MSYDWTYKQTDSEFYLINIDFVATHNYTYYLAWLKTYL